MTTVPTGILRQLLVCLLLIGGCGSTEEGSAVQAFIRLSPMTGMVVGRVTDVESGAAPQRAQLVVGATRAPVAADGSFALVANVGRQRLVVEGPGVMPNGFDAVVAEEQIPDDVLVMRRAPAQMVSQTGGTLTAGAATVTVAPGALPAMIDVSVTHVTRARVGVLPLPAQFIDGAGAARRMVGSVEIDLASSPALVAVARVPLPADATAQSTRVYRLDSAGRPATPVDVTDVEGGFVRFPVERGQYVIAVDTRTADGSRRGFVVVAAPAERAREGQVLAASSDEMTVTSSGMALVDPRGARVTVTGGTRLTLQDAAFDSAPTKIAAKEGVVRVAMPAQAMLVTAATDRSLAVAALELSGPVALVRAGGGAFSLTACTTGGHSLDVVAVVEGSVEVTAGGRKSTVTAGQIASFCAGCAAGAMPICDRPRGADGGSSVTDAIRPDAAAPDAPPDVTATDGPATMDGSGSPCPASSGPTMHASETITQDTVWTAAGSPHVVTGSVSIRAKVTLEPCTEVTAGRGASIGINGTLEALGEAARPIYIGSRDVAAPFGLITVNPGGQLRLSHTLIERGGSNNSALNPTVLVRGSTPPAESLFVDNVRIASGTGAGLIMENGARFAAASQALTITDCSQPLLMHIDTATSLPVGNYSGNRLDRISIAGNATVDATIRERGTPYRVGWPSQLFAQLRIESAMGQPPAVVTIEPGVVLRFPKDAANPGVVLVGFSPTATAPRGALVAVGTAQRPIVFTSEETTPAAGDWIGLRFAGALDPRNRLEHVTVAYAGGPAGLSGYSCLPPATPDRGAILFAATAPATAFITNCTIDSSSGHGVYSGWQGAPVDFVAPNTFTNIAFCKQTPPKDTQGRCPSPVMCLP